MIVHLVKSHQTFGSSGSGLEKIKSVFFMCERRRDMLSTDSLVILSFVSRIKLFLNECSCKMSYGCETASHESIFGTVALESRLSEAEIEKFCTVVKLIN